MPELVLIAWGTKADARGDEALRAAARMNPRNNILFLLLCACSKGDKSDDHGEANGCAIYIVDAPTQVEKAMSLYYSDETMPEFW